MLNKERKTIYTQILLLYILIQPVIDIMTSYFLLKLEITITPGLIIRNMALVFGVFYVLIKEKKHVIYLIFIGIFYVCHTIMNFLYKEVWNAYQEISYFSKYVFFIVALIVISHVIRESDYSIKEKILKTLWIVMGIISLCIIIGALTQTGIQSYGSEKIGQTGWFFSGTKISAAMAILFPVSLLYTIKRYPQYRILSLFMVLCNIIAMFMTGTKTSYMGILVGMIAAVGILCIRWMKGKERDHKSSIVILSLILMAVIAYTPYSPVYKNINIHQSWQGEDKPSIIFNGREIKVGNARQDYIEANAFRKLLGVGYGGDYEEIRSVIPIERDFHEIFFYYGIIGSILLLYYPVKRVSLLVRNYFSSLKSPDIEESMLMASIASGIGCSFIAGHVLFAPSVSIFLACVMSLLYKR